MVPSEVLNSREFLASGPRPRFLILTAWCLPERRFGGLFTLSLRRLAYYTAMDEESLAQDVRAVNPATLRWDADAELLWLPEATRRDVARINAKQLKGLAGNLLQAPVCDLRDEVQEFIAQHLPVDMLGLWSPLLSGAVVPHGIPHPKPHSNGPLYVDVDVSVDVPPEEAAAAAERNGHRPPILPQATPEVEALVDRWNAALAGSRLVLPPVQAAAAARLAICRRHLDAGEEVIRAVCRSPYLRNEAPFASFVWAFSPQNADKLLAGGWAPGGPPPPPPPQPVVEFHVEPEAPPTPEELAAMDAEWETWPETTRRLMKRPSLRWANK